MQQSSSDSRAAGRRDVASTFIDLVDESGQQMANAARAAQPLVDAWVGLFRMVAALPAATVSSAGRSMGQLTGDSCCCEIPETDCPPRCVCDIDWEGMRGQQLAATITVRNTRKAAQNFSLTVTPFEGPDGSSGEAATVQPASLHVNAGGSATATVGFQVPAAFDVGETYDAEVRVTGLYEQCVRVRLRVRPVPHCDVSQGEIPTRIRAHRWYEHFQCEELCFEPVRTGSQPDRPAPPAAAEG